MNLWKMSAAILGVALLVAGCQSDGPQGATAVQRAMTVTAYCDCKVCCNWERTWYGKPVVATGPGKGEYKKPGRTASGSKARRGTIAAGSQYPFGTLMEVPGYGRGVVQDRGSAITGDHIDVFFKRHRDALEWGRQRVQVTIWMADNAST